jgi:hypothetical protein
MVRLIKDVLDIHRLETFDLRQLLLHMGDSFAMELCSGSKRSQQECDV